MEVFIYLVTLILSSLSIFLGIKTDIFGKDPSSALLTSAIASLLILLFGDRLAASQRERSFHQKLKTIFHGLPNIDVIKEFPTCDEALEYIINRLSEAKTVQNTKISKKGIESRSDVAKRYNVAIKKALKNNLVFKDVISGVFEDYSKALLEYSKQQKGRYKFMVRDIDAPCFLNFIILDYGDERELIFGWVTSSYLGSEQKAYKVRDKRVIEYFSQYHGALFSHV